MKQAAEITRIKEHVSRMALMNNNVAITVLDSGEFDLRCFFCVFTEHNTRKTPKNIKIEFCWSPVR